MSERYDRRDVLKLGASGIVAGLAGCNAVGSAGSSLETQLDDVRSATEEYADPQAAVEAGFQVTGPVAPGQGWHFVNEERVQAAAQEGVDRSEPQVLTYDTDMNLVAVEWAVPAEAVDEAPDLFDDGDAEATEEWHTHQASTHVFADGDGAATDPGSLSFDALSTTDNWAGFHPPDTGIEPGDEVALEWGVEGERSDDGESRVVDIAATHPTIETLHVWVHEENPEGVFNPVHPDVAGDGHDHDH